CAGGWSVAVCPISGDADRTRTAAATDQKSLIVSLRRLSPQCRSIVLGESWMKLVEFAPVAARANSERGAELGVHVRLVAIAELGREHGQRSAPAAKREAEAGEAHQPLERAERNAARGAKSLGDVNRVAIR